MRSCWALKQSGVEPARIAERFKISVQEVEEYVDLFDAERQLHSSGIVDDFISREVMIGLDGAGMDLKMARKAVRYSGRDNPVDGTPIMERDWTTAIEAIRAGGEMLDRVRPKGGGVNVAVGINNNGNGQSSTTVRSFEQRVRELRDKRELMLGEGQQKSLPMASVSSVETNAVPVGDGTTEAELEEMDELEDDEELESESDNGSSDDAEDSV